MPDEQSYYTNNINPIILSVELGKNILQNCRNVKCKIFLADFQSSVCWSLVIIKYRKDIKTSKRFF